MSVAPLPVAPRPFPDETLRSWADRVGAWYELSGTELVDALRTAAYPLGDTGFISLEDAEHEGITPPWATELLADAARLPRARVQAMTQDDYARWIPPSTLWNVLATHWPRCCRHCIAACGEAHNRRAWRSGWVSVCPEHGVVLGREDQPPSPYAIGLEAALREAVDQRQGWVRFPWPVAGHGLTLSLSLALQSLAEIAEYLCDDAEMLVVLDRLRPTGLHAMDNNGVCSVRLVDIAAYLAREKLDNPVSNNARSINRWSCRRGLSATQHHRLMASLGWLLSDWPVRLFRLLGCTEFVVPKLTSMLRVLTAANFTKLRQRGHRIAWPLWRHVENSQVVFE